MKNRDPCVNDDVFISVIQQTEHEILYIEKKVNEKQ